MTNFRFRFCAIFMLTFSQKSDFVACAGTNTRKLSNKGYSKLLQKGPIPDGFLLKPHLRFETKPQTQSLPEGSSVLLDCEVFGSPVPMVHWEFLGNSKSIYSVISSGSFIQSRRQKVLGQANWIDRDLNKNVRTFQQGTTLGRYRIPCLDAESEGRYVCTAGNGYKTVVREIEVTISDVQNNLRPSCSNVKQGKKARPALVSMWTVDRIERAGVAVQMNCRATGNPAPKVTWSYWSDDKPLEISNGNPNYQMLENGDLLVLNTTTRPTGRDLRCTASNAFGTDVVDQALYIMFPDQDE